MCGVEFNDRKRAEALMLMLGLIETIDQLVMAKSAHDDHVLRREDSDVLRS